jgi:hypothetical protein
MWRIYDQPSGQTLTDEGAAGWGVHSLTLFLCVGVSRWCTYVQGRGPKSNAFTHALEAGHHVFMKLETGKVYCLPDGCELDEQLVTSVLLGSPTQCRVCTGLHRAPQAQLHGSSTLFFGHKDSLRTRLILFRRSSQIHSPSAAARRWLCYPPHARPLA